MGKETTHLVVETVGGRWYILSSLCTRKDTQIIQIERYTGRLLYSGQVGIDLFSNSRDALNYISKGRKILKSVIKCHAILGYYTIGSTGYLHVATKVSLDMLLPPKHKIFTIQETQCLRINLGYPFSLSKLEQKNADLMTEFPISGLHFYCDTLDITRPYPSKNQVQDYDPEFCWNHFITREFRRIGLRQWACVLLEGISMGKIVTAPEAPNGVHVNILARRSSLNPGTRYHSRGLNEHSSPGNEYEVEQILWKVNGADKSLFEFSTAIWRRGTVPIHWKSVIKTAVQVDAEIVISDKPYENVDVYYKRLLNRYGNVPITIVNLLRTRQVHAQEGVLAEHYQESVQLVKKLMNIQIEKLDYDWHHTLKKEGLDHAVEGLWKLVGPKIREAGVNVGTLRTASNSSAAPASDWLLEVKMSRRQNGFLRVNCADSLDRTNLSTFFNGMHMLAEQCKQLGVSLCLDRGEVVENWATLSFNLEKIRGTFDSNLLLYFAEMYIHKGDVCATLFTNTVAMHTSAIRDFATHLPSAPSNAVILVERRIQNVYKDKTRQSQYEMFLGLKWNKYFPSHLNPFHTAAAGAASTPASPMPGKPLNKKQLAHQQQPTQSAQQQQQQQQQMMYHHGNLSFLSSYPAFIFKSVPAEVSLKTSEEYSLLTHGSKYIWVCPRDYDFIELNIFLPHYCRVTELAVTIRHGVSDHSSPSKMDVFVGQHIDNAKIGFQEMFIPRCEDGTKLLYTLPSHISGIPQNSIIYDFEGSIASYKMRVVRVTFYGIPPAMFMTIGQIQVFGVLENPNFNAANFEFLIQNNSINPASSTSSKISNAIQAISDLQNSNFNALAPLLNNGDKDDDDDEDEDDDEDDEEEDQDAEDEKKEKPKMQQTSAASTPEGVTGTTTAVTAGTNAAVKSEEKKEVVGNYFALPKGTHDITEFLDESLSNAKKQASAAATAPASSSSSTTAVVTPANTEAAVQEAKAKYMSFLKSKCPKPSSKITFKDALELDLARMKLGLSSQDRDAILVEHGYKVANFDPNKFVFRRDEKIEKEITKKNKQSSKQCTACNSGILLGKYMCHYCKNAFCKNCISKDKKHIIEFCWNTAHQVCHECSDNIGRQQRMIKEIREIQQLKNKTSSSGSGSGNRIASPTGESAAASSVSMEDMFDPFFSSYFANVNVTSKTALAADPSATSALPSSAAIAAEVAAAAATSVSASLPQPGITASASSLDLSLMASTPLVLDTLVSEFPNAGILTSVATDAKSPPIELLLFPSNVYPDSYWYAPAGVAEVRFIIILSSYATLSKFVIQTDKFGYSADDMLDVRVSIAERLPAFYQQLEWKLDSQHEGAVKPNDQIELVVPPQQSEKLTRLIQVELKLRRGKETPETAFIHLKRLQIFGKVRAPPDYAFTLPPSAQNVYDSVLKLKPKTTRIQLRCESRFIYETNTIDLTFLQSYSQEKKEGAGSSSSASSSSGSSSSSSSAQEKKESSSSSSGGTHHATVSGFRIVVEHGARGGVHSQVKDIRVSLLSYNEKKEFSKQSVIGIFTIPKVASGTSLYYDFEKTYERVGLVRFEFLNNYGADEICHGKLFLFANSITL